jgi:hypothetical protein
VRSFFTESGVSAERVPMSTAAAPAVTASLIDVPLPVK